MKQIWTGLGLLAMYLILPGLLFQPGVSCNAIKAYREGVGGDVVYLPLIMRAFNFTITRVSVASDGAQSDRDSLFSSISPDGRYIAFDSWASNLVSGDTNDTQDVLFMISKPGKPAVSQLLLMGHKGMIGRGHPLFRLMVATWFSSLWLPVW